MPKAILLIEDNPDDIELTMMAFAQHNLANEIMVINDGEDALRYLFGEDSYADRSAYEPPLVILLDLKLPKVDGLEVLQRLRADARTTLIPVVVLTTSSEERDMVQSYKLGANSYVRKPVEFARFVEAVRQLGMYWMLLNEVPHARSS